MLLFLSKAFFSCYGVESVIKPSPNYLVILVHGIAETSDIFDDDGSGHLKPYLEDSLSLPGYVYAYDFNDNKGSNVVAADELGNQFIPRALNDFKAWYASKNHIAVNDIPQNVIPQKVVLIAKSEGGLASRVYLTSNYYHDNVRKLITLDTPHLGSDAVTYKKLLYTPENVAMTMAYAGVGLGYIILQMQAHTASFADIYFDGAIFAGIVSPTEQFILKDFVAKWGDPALDEMDPEGDFIKHLKGAEVLPNKSPIEYRLVSAHGFPSPDIEGIKSFYLLKGIPLINAIATPFDSRYWDLPTTQAKVESVAAAVAISGGTFTKDGSIVVDIDSAYGHGVSLFSQNTKRYDYLFYNEPVEEFLNVQINNEYNDIHAVQALSGFNPALNCLDLIPIADMGSVIATNLGTAIDIGTIKIGGEKEDSLIYNAFAHHHLVEKVYSEGSPNIIDQCLFDTPMATVTHLDTDVSTEEYNISQKIVHTGTIQPVEILNTSEASDTPPYAADRSVSLIFNEGTTNEVEKYTSSMLVKAPVTQISGVIHDFKPLMLQSFQISENFAAWQEFHPNTCSTHTDPQGFKYIDVDANKFHLHMDEWGKYTISGLNFAEGQNLIGFKLTNRAKYSSNQVLKVIQNTIPMQASKYQPESNFMTNNVYQPISVEFNKSTYYEDEAGKIQIVSFEVDGTPMLSNANITSEIDGAYHPYARVNYTPKTPLSDGEHAIVVSAKSDVGVSQAIWAFFVDTQPPTISIEALSPFSPRAPGTGEANNISIRYTTTDNLSTFLRSITARLYDSNNNFITELATFDTQAVGENFIPVNSTQLTVNGSLIPDGNYSIKIKAYDQAGNVTTESVALVIDSTPPSIIQADVNPKPMTSNSDSLNFSSQLSENSIVTIKMINKATNVASAYITQAQRAGSEESATASYSWSYNNQFGSNGPDDGIYRLEITAQDQAGNVSDPYVIDNVKIDRTPPFIFSNACLPYVLANVGNDPYTTTLSYQVSESNDKPENQDESCNVTVSLFNENSGELIKTWDNAPANIGEVNSINWNGDSTQYGNGSYKFAITATDASGNSSTAYSSCVKNGIAPVISFPANNGTVSGTIAIRGTAVDPDWTNNLPFKDYKIYYANGNVQWTGGSGRIRIRLCGDPTLSKSRMLTAIRHPVSGIYQ